MEKQVKSQRKLLTKKQFKRTLTMKSGIVGFKPTPIMAAHWFRKLNEVLFDRRLSHVEIHIKKLHNDWGRCIADWDNRHCRKGTFNQRIIPFQKTEVFYRIELHCKFPKWKDFIETLAHEMVHLYQMQVMKDPYSNHNANFYSFRDKFRSVGLRLYR